MQSKKMGTGLLMPVFYIAFITVGLLLFILVAQKIKIPVYRTYAVSVNKEAGKTYIDFSEEVPVTDAKIYLYVARDESVTGIDEYQYSETCESIILDGDYFEDGVEMSADIRISEVSLLQYILKGKAE